jgi:hypothetical protein
MGEEIGLVPSIHILALDCSIYSILPVDPILIHDTSPLLLASPSLRLAILMGESSQPIPNKPHNKYGSMQMPMRVRIYTESTGYVEAEILEDKNPKTAKAIIEGLPFDSRANTWGEEVYFSIPVDIDEENSQREVEVGDCGYWPAGNCFCIFFGRTPASRGDKPVAASPVNIFGRIVGDAKIFRKVRDGERIRVEKI